MGFVKFEFFTTTIDFTGTVTSSTLSAKWIFQNGYTIVSNNPKLTDPLLNTNAGINGTTQKVILELYSPQAVSQVNLGSLSITQGSFDPVITVLETTNALPVNFVFLLQNNNLTISPADAARLDSLSQQQIYVVVFSTTMTTDITDYV